MSREGLTRAYKRGQISRREFVRGMVSLGLTIGAATRLADSAIAAVPQPGSAAVDDVYGGEAVLDAEIDANAQDQLDPDHVAGNTGGRGGGGSVPGDGPDADNIPDAYEVAHIRELPNVGVGQDDQRSRTAAALLGMGSAVAAAAALGFRRRRTGLESLSVWPGWSTNSERDPEPPSNDPRALPQGKK